jgi:hypothetical protein
MQQHQEAGQVQHLLLHLPPQQQHGCRWTPSPGPEAATQLPHLQQQLREPLLQLQQ